MVFGANDIGWAGAFTPLICSAETLAELRNLAGMPRYPGQKTWMVDLVTGECKWYQRSTNRGGGQRSRRRGRR